MLELGLGLGFGSELETRIGYETHGYAKVIGYEMSGSVVLSSYNSTVLGVL